MDESLNGVSVPASAPRSVLPVMRVPKAGVASWTRLLHERAEAAPP